MTRLVLSILLSVMIVCQSALAGLIFCSGGGAFHIEASSTHASDHPHHHGSSCGHHHGSSYGHHHADHSHSIVGDSDSTQPCECTDVEFSDAEAVPGTRDVVSPQALKLFPLGVDFQLTTESCVQAQFAPPRSAAREPAQHHLAVLRAVRLRL
ncbi:MAG: hypothetical protein AAF432_00245 [Planctomycetota bacterium]